MIVYGTMEFELDPQTGRRIGRLRDGGALETCSVEELRIVDQDIWDKVQARHAELDRRAAARKRPAATPCAPGTPCDTSSQG
jgi:hypothetical protein